LILEFLDDKTRQNAILINTSIHHHLVSEESFQWRLERLHQEHGVYFQTKRRCCDDNNHDVFLSSSMPTTTPSMEEENTATTSNRTGMRQLFLHNFALRHMWTDPDHDHDKKSKNHKPDGFETTISVRFKPMTPKEDRKDKENNSLAQQTKRATLPLTQRLALLKISHNLSSNKQAFELLGKLQEEAKNVKKKY